MTFSAAAAAASLKLDTHVLPRLGTANVFRGRGRGLIEAATQTSPGSASCSTFSAAAAAASLKLGGHEELLVARFPAFSAAAAAASLKPRMGSWISSRVSRRFPRPRPRPH